MKLLVLLSVLSVVQSANILYLSNIASPSHFIWCKSLLNSLHARGHNITALSPDVEESKENFTYHHLEKVYASLYNGSTDLNFFEMGKKSTVEMFIEFFDFFKNAAGAALDSKGYQDMLKYPDDFKVDLVIHDFTGFSSLLGMVHKFNNPPMVSVTPYLFSGKFATISGSLLYPAFLPPPDLRVPQQMTFMQRVQSFLFNLFEIGFDKFYIQPTMDELVHKVHPNAPNVEEIEKRNSKIFLINTQPITDYRIPSFPNAKLVGGVQIQKPKDLPAELRMIADAATNGLVLFSLGTNVRSDSLGEERIAKIIKALERLPKYTFLWKFETKEKLPVDLPRNVHIQSWMPQNDVLAHPNTKLFISHCGLLSTQEALWYGVPVLGFPVMGDQPQNAHRLKELGVGEVLSIHDFTENEFYETIKQLIEVPKYQKKIKEISEALHDRPMTPLEEATYWSEWVLRHPHIDIGSPAVNMNLFARHSFDVIAAFSIVIVLFCLFWVKLIKFAIRCCWRKEKKVDIDKKRN
jgi:glucuronosyltransferase